MKKIEHRAKLDISKITDYVYLGADMCCGGDHYKYLCREKGIKADIAVLEERLESPSKLLEVFLWLPVKDKTAPKQHQLDAGVEVIKAMVDNKQKVFVHCRLGHGRSPTLVAAYLISRGVAVDQAIEAIKKARSEIHPNEIQVEALTEFSERHRANEKHSNS